VATQQAGTMQLPDDREELLKPARTLLAERDRKDQQVEQLQVELLRLQQELERYKKWYYGPRADRLRSPGELLQLLLDFAEQLESKPPHPDDVPPRAAQEQQLRRVKRRKGRRNLANFENLPVNTHVYELGSCGDRILIPQQDRR
jgi:hypothetical protein